ncbi:MAG: Arc family DNA-binding protein [Tannerellaceae bacterium]|jgi:hypothetical protein|nr:Arc family DNA-binding protein [Tannerellaceae bacterium]
MPKRDSANKTFILRIDPDMMDAIEKWAADEFRSINGQILFILDQALRKAGRVKKEKEKKE